MLRFWQPSPNLQLVAVQEAERGAEREAPLQVLQEPQVLQPPRALQALQAAAPPRQVQALQLSQLYPLLQA